MEKIKWLISYHIHRVLFRYKHHRRQHFDSYGNYVANKTYVNMDFFMRVNEEHVFLINHSKEGLSVEYNR